MSRAWLALAVAIGGCGRLDFDELDDGRAVPTGPLAVEPTYATAPAWNDYVRVESPGVPLYRQPGTLCTGTEPACTHAGEQRKVVLPGLTSCTGVSARDALDALQWICDDAGGAAVVYATGLRDGAGLRDLVDVAGWRMDQVIVTFRTGEQRSTDPSVWWPNPIVPLPDNAGMAWTVLAESGAVYVLGQSRATGGYSIEADKVALVTLRGATLSWSAAALDCNDITGETANANAHCVITAGDQAFPWVEATVDAADSASHGVFYGGVRFGQVRGARVASSQSSGVAVVGGRASRVTDVTVASSGLYGLVVSAGATGTIVDNVRVFGNGTANQNGSAGVIIADAAHNVFTRITTANNYNYGILGYATASENTYSHITAGNNDSTGVDLQDGGGSTLVVALAVNQSSVNVRFESPANQAADIAAAHALVGFCSLAGGVTVTGTLALGSHATADCRLGSVCGSTMSCDTWAGTAAYASGLDARGALRYKVTTDDAANASDTSGAAALASVSDWLRFDDPQRGWGNDGNAFPDPTNLSFCATTCRIWDWRHAAGDTSIALDPTSFVAGAPCPPNVDGDRALTDRAGNTFLIDALEVIGDGVGDDDGLCESNEACARSAFFGADQPAPGTATCAFHDGLVRGVVMHGS